MKSKFLTMLTIIMVGMMSVCLSSCSKDDDKEGSDEKENSDKDLIGYWIPEDPDRFTGTMVRGYRFLGEGEVHTFSITADYYSYYQNDRRAANWDIRYLTEFKGVSVYIEHNSLEVEIYERNGNKIIINPTSDPELITITGSDRFIVSSRGAFVRVIKH